MPWPAFYHVRQNFGSDPVIEDVEAAVARELGASGILDRVRPGHRIAITGGSRGVAKIPAILRAVGKAISSRGAQPFVITAMGSHGGGTASGQLAVLNELGVHEATVGMPVQATMDTRRIGETPDGCPVYMDRLALESDGVFVVGRVKKHTDFHGPIESGLCKMLVLGLGKVPQANLIHAHRPSQFPQAIESVARTMLRTGKILAGLAIIENRRGQTAILHPCLPQDIPDRDKEFLVEANRYFAQLPFDEADVLIVRRIGKEISGSGMDTNVIGRTYIEGEPDPRTPLIYVIGVLELTEATAGNAVGLGLADLTTQRAVRAVDFHKTNLNTITSGFLIRAKIPITLRNDRELIDTALRCVQGPFRDRPRIALIEDTLHVESTLVSESLSENLNTRDAEIHGPVPVDLDDEGNLRRNLFPST